MKYIKVGLALFFFSDILIVCIDIIRTFTIPGDCVISFILENLSNIIRGVPHKNNKPGHVNTVTVNHNIALLISMTANQLITFAKWFR